MTTGRSAQRLGAALLLAALAACGGGGGGGGGAAGVPQVPLQYSGSTSPASVSTTNAGRLTNNVVGGGDVSGAGASIAGAGAEGSAQGQLNIGRRLARNIRTLALPRADGRPGPATAITIDQTSPCQDGGTLRLAGTLSDGGIGTLSASYDNCRKGDEVMNGPATLRVDAFDIPTTTVIDGTLSFVRMTLRGSLDVDLTGTVRVQANLATNTETATENVVALYNRSGHLTKSENLIFIEVYDNILSPASYVESITGRIFDSTHGFVDVTTNAPFLYGSVTQLLPHAGEIVLTGSGASRIRATAISTAVVALALDANGDGVDETFARVPWSALGAAAGSDLADDDGDGMHNSWESAHGLDPASAADAAADSDGDGLSNLAEYQAGSDPNAAGAPPPGGALPGQVITLSNASDLIYDPGTARIYAAVRGNPGSLVPIDPLTGVLSSPIAAGIDPVKLARSDDGQYLYVGLDGQAAVQRVALLASPPAVDLTFALGTGTHGAFYAEDIEVLPGSAASVAVTLAYKSVSPRHAGVAIFDSGVARPQTTPGHTGSNVIEFSASAATLYGYNNTSTEFGFRRMSVDASGVTTVDNFTSFDGDLIQGFGVDIRFGGGLIFTTNGRVVDPVARTVLGAFPLTPLFGNLVVPDAALNRVFYLTNDSAAAGWRIRAFDMTTRADLGSADIPGVSGTPGSLIRWGAKGLAFRTSNGQIFLVQSATLIP